MQKPPGRKNKTDLTLTGLLMEGVSLSLHCTFLHIVHLCEKRLHGFYLGVMMVYGAKES